jgi:hypothetical protein
MAEYHLVGEPFDEEDRPQVFELRVSDHLDDINPSKFDIDNVESIDPTGYFITSGDALAKALQLEKDLWKLAGNLRSCGGKRQTKKYKQYVSAVWKCAGATRRLVNILRTVKGGNCFLETEWSSNRQLLCIPKNPRSKQT